MRRLAPLLLCALAGCAAPSPDGVTELVYATPYSPSHPFSRADQTWIEHVERRSGGSLRIRTIWSGALLAADQSMIELRHGVADIGLITPIYAKGGAHLIRTQSGFYTGVQSVEDQVAMYRCLERSSPQITAELAGLRILAVQGGSLPGLITRERPVERLSDLRGLRIRAPTELLRVLRELGADPVNLPMGEVYSALAKGVLDGVIAPADTFRALHFAEVTRWYTELVVPRGAYPARAMGEASWQRLRPEHRELLAAAVPVWEGALAEETRAAVVTGFAAARAAGVRRIPMAAGEQERFDALYLRDAERNAAALERYGIDGMRVFHLARASVRGDGSIGCREEQG